MQGVLGRRLFNVSPLAPWLSLDSRRGEETKGGPCHRVSAAPPLKVLIPLLCRKRARGRSLASNKGRYELGCMPPLQSVHCLDIHQRKILLAQPYAEGKEIFGHSGLATPGSLFYAALRAIATSIDGRAANGERLTEMHSAPPRDGGQQGQGRAGPGRDPACCVREPTSQVLRLSAAVLVRARRESPCGAEMADSVGMGNPLPQVQTGKTGDRRLLHPRCQPAVADAACCTIRIARARP